MASGQEPLNCSKFDGGEERDSVTLHGRTPAVTEA
jgi:hypothetical protein